jgi:hypothetical protein
MYIVLPSLYYASYPICKNTHYILYYDMPSTIVLNPHRVGLASLHGVGVFPQVAEMHYIKIYIHTYT